MRASQTECSSCSQLVSCQSEQANLPTQTHIQLQVQSQPLHTVSTPQQTSLLLALYSGSKTQRYTQHNCTACSGFTLRNVQLVLCWTCHRRGTRMSRQHTTHVPKTSNTCWHATNRPHTQQSTYKTYRAHTAAAAGGCAAHRCRRGPAARCCCCCCCTAASRAAGPACSSTHHATCISSLNWLG